MRTTWLATLLLLPMLLMGNEEFSTIPSIDVEALQHSTGEEREALVRDFGDKLREVGFVSFKVSPEFQEVIDRALLCSKQYFAQSLEDKLEDWHDNNGQTGYSPYGLETAAGRSVADLKETYFIPEGYSRWPAGNEEFTEVMQEFHGTMTLYSKLFFSLIAEYFGEDSTVFDNPKANELNLIRLAHYLAPAEGQPTQAVWAGAHKDLNGLTLLPRPSQPGLELLMKDGTWRKVFVPKGHVILNCGLQVEMKTAGMIEATPHRVINPGIRTDRHAIIYFGSLAADFPLKPFPQCAAESDQEWPDVTVLENLLSRLIELGSFSDPDEELVRDLHSKGLIQQPTDAIRKQYPDLF